MYIDEYPNKVEVTMTFSSKFKSGFEEKRRIMREIEEALKIKFGSEIGGHLLYESISVSNKD